VFVDRVVSKSVRFMCERLSQSNLLLDLLSKKCVDSEALTIDLYVIV